jgi:hypothetical protein
MRHLTLLALFALLVAPASAGPEATRKKARSIANILTTQKISVELEKATLDQFVKFVRTATGVNIVVNKARIERDGGDVDAIEVTLTVKNVKVIDALKLALQGHELGLKLKGNILYITSTTSRPRRTPWASRCSGSTASRTCSCRSATSRRGT